MRTGVRINAHHRQIRRRASWEAGTPPGREHARTTGGEHHRRVQGLRNTRMWNRRQFVTVSGGLAIASAPSGQTRPHDILTKKGEVRDPTPNYKARPDVAIRDGKIAATESAFPAERGREVVDAKGLYVVPGLVDLH